MVFKKLLLICMVIMQATLANAQNNWVLKADKDGIKVYTRPMPGSKVKAIKVECTLQAGLSQLAYIIMDINSCKQWVYSTKSCGLLKQVSPHELFYYSEVDVPWPVSNRDFVAHLTASQNPVNRTVTIDAENVPGFTPQKPNVVRIVQSVGKWLLTPAGGHLVNVEYTLFADPGGSVPAWLINLFITKGPMESFKKLKEHLAQPFNAHVHLPLIKD